MNEQAVQEAVSAALRSFTPWQRLIIRRTKHLWCPTIVGIIGAATRAGVVTENQSAVLTRAIEALGERSV